jgi:hypothetical protein
VAGAGAGARSNFFKAEWGRETETSREGDRDREIDKNRDRDREMGFSPTLSRLARVISCDFISFLSVLSLFIALFRF